MKCGIIVAIRRFNERQQSLQSQPTTSRVITSATLRKQKSRATLTEEQNANILTQDRISHQIHYAIKQEYFRNQFLKVGCCTIDNYIENIINGDEIENGRHKFKKMNIICGHSPLSPAPQYLHSLLTTNDPITNEPYVNQIRAYNQVLAFTSLGANIDENLANAKDGIYTFRIQGALYHQIGSLMLSIGIEYIFRANEIEPESDLMEIDENETAQITENESENGSDNEGLLTIQRSIKKFDQYAKWESNNLRWYRENQKHLRTEIYSGLQDIISEEDINTGNIGKKVILSSSFTGSVRYSMAIVREFGKHDLFITFTCNLKWPEITNELLPNQQASDCPDLVVRVFKLKLKLIT
ncbi:uncharacterized protein LOC114268814 [Rhizophagus clarus]|uniref:Uncharacterized protein LOC114268814 n=1 Tax=Rhizophagus clarus TaxID=94130 RepID=A0A8H3LUP4_9GLOM|nr:uncharacterized protein LOC114268814 [Rhizophagus clarus]